MTHDNSYDEMIRKAGWFKGSQRQWDALDRQTQRDLAFAALGCQEAYATWTGPVDCSHCGCQVRRGEIKPLIETNRVIKGEMQRGYLRFSKASRERRAGLARLIRAIRNHARETGIYDPWKMPNMWQFMVAEAIG